MVSRFLEVKEFRVSRFRGFRCCVQDLAVSGFENPGPMVHSMAHRSASRFPAGLCFGDGVRTASEETVNV